MDEASMSEFGSTVRLTVNGQPIERQVDARSTLRDLLHDELACNEVKLACAEGVCGACVVLVNGKPLASCMKLAVQADGCEVTTVAGARRAWRTCRVRSRGVARPDDRARMFSVWILRTGLRG